MNAAEPYAAMISGAHMSVTLTIQQWQDVQAFLESHPLDLAPAAVRSLAHELAEWDLNDPEQTCAHAWGHWPNPCPTCAADRRRAGIDS